MPWLALGLFLSAAIAHAFLLDGPSEDSAYLASTQEQLAWLTARQARLEMSYDLASLRLKPMPNNFKATLARFVARHGEDTAVPYSSTTSGRLHSVL